MTETQQETVPVKYAHEDATDAAFIEALETVLMEYGVKGHAGIFVRKDKPTIVYGPDVVKGTKLLHLAHSKCRAEVLKLIGE